MVWWQVEQKGEVPPGNRPVVVVGKVGRTMAGRHVATRNGGSVELKLSPDQGEWCVCSKGRWYGVCRRTVVVVYVKERRKGLENAEKRGMNRQVMQAVGSQVPPLIRVSSVMKYTETEMQKWVVGNKR